MAKDVIHYDTQCMEALHAELGRIRKTLQSHATTLRMINLVRTGADIHTCRMPSISLKTTGTRVSSGLTPIVLHRSASAISDLAEYIEVLQKKIKRVAEVFEECEQQISTITLETDVEKLPAKTENSNKEEDLDYILTMLHHVTPPDQLPSVKYCDFWIDNPFSKNAHNSLSFFTGNFSEFVDSPALREFFTASGPPTNSLFYPFIMHTLEHGADMQYSFNAFFNGLSYEGFEPVTLDSRLKELLSSAPDGTSEFVASLPDDFANIMGIIFSALELGEVSNRTTETGGVISTLVGLSDDMINECLTAYNQFSLLQSLDKEDVMARVQVYKATKDPTLYQTAVCMEGLVNASPEVQAAFLTGKATLGFAEDVTNAVLFTLTTAALDKGLPGSGKITSIVSSVSDFAGNAGSIPELANNMRHASDNVRKVFDVYENAVKAYDKNPTPENLKKATDAYETYQQACADSMKTYDDYMNNIETSKAGQVITDTSNTDWIGKQEQNYRDQAQTMDFFSDRYFS